MPEGAWPAAERPGASAGAGAAGGPPTRRSRRFALAAILAGALMLLAATALIGRPSVFTDTDDYFAQGRSVIRVLKERIVQGRPIVDWAEVRDRAQHGGGDEEPVHNQDGARSAYYGVALYVLESLGTLWLVALGQALIGSGLVYAFWRAAAPAAGPASFLVLMGVLALASTLPAFTGFAMPDVFAGFSALSMVLLMVYPDRFGWGAQAGLFALLVAAMNFHTSNVLTALALLAASLALLAFLGRPRGELLRRGAMVLAAVVLALSGSALYAKVVELRSGDALGHPPFLTARVLADGPGRAYLASVCRTSSPYEICRAKWLPLDDSEDILWSDDPSRGVFNLSEFATRQNLTRQDFRFALGSTLRDPVGQALASGANWGRQLVNTRLDEPLMGPDFYLRDAYWKTTNLPKLILRAAPWCGRKAGACRPPLDPEVLAVLDGVLAVLAGGLVLLRLRQGRWLSLARNRAFEDPFLRAGFAALLIFAAVVLNALVCGALSGPFPRYQARVLWLAPAAAFVLEIAWRRARASARVRASGW